MSTPPKASGLNIWGDGVGEKTGVEIWRIEKMAPVRQPAGDSGKFCTGDSYIVLNTFEVKGSKRQNVHFWLGKESTQDERGAAAILTAELDQFLGDLPVQFRELQGSESPEFLQTFANGVMYVEGGVESGFKHVEKDVYEPRLLQVKGRRNVRILVVKLEVASLNSGDVFILDMGLTIYQWNGKDASRSEKAKGLDISVAIKDEERGGRAKIIAINEGDENEGVTDFFKALGHSGPPSSAKIKTEAEGGADDSEAAVGGPMKLYEVLDAKGDKWNLVEARPLTREMMKTDSAFVLIAGGVVYSWIGQKCDNDRKKNAMQSALAFAKRNQVPESASVKVIKEGTEPPLFKQCYEKWTALVLPKAPPRSFSAGAGQPASPTVERKVTDAMAMVKAQKEAGSEDKPVDDGSGELTVWRIEHFERAAWPRELYGQFYSGDSYIVLYKYKDAQKRDAALIYFWLGRDSSQDEKGAAALQAKALDDEMGGWPVQVRVVQGKEPSHFFMLFKGKMVVFQGGKASGFKNVQEEDVEFGSERALFHVRGTNEVNTRAMQVKCEAACLNSGDCFVAILPQTAVYLWEGKFSSDEEKHCASLAMATLGHEAKVPSKDWIKIQEGAEPEAFWEALGGKAEYPEFTEGAVPAQDPRLFQLCDAVVGGHGITVEEVYNFAQDDLCDDDIMMLDTYREVFLWIGRGANENEKREAETFAASYVAAAAATDGRDKDTPIMKVSAGSEPALFTSNFTGWDSNANKAFIDPYQAKLAKLAEKKEKQQAAASPGVTLRVTDKPGPSPNRPVEAASPRSVPEPTVKPGSKVIPYAQLINMRLEDGIAPEAKQEYLSPEEFAELFKMDKAAFDKLAKWKQADIKKKLHLF